MSGAVKALANQLCRTDDQFHQLVYNHYHHHIDTYEPPSFPSFPSFPPYLPLPRSFPSLPPSLSTAPSLLFPSSVCLCVCVFVVDEIIR